MKKSMLFKMAQMSVVRDNILDDSSKLEVLRALMNEEDISKLVEKNKEEKNKEGDSNEENRE
jgi:hypothetical protein